MYITLQQPPNIGLNKFRVFLRRFLQDHVNRVRQKTNGQMRSILTFCELPHTVIVQQSFPGFLVNVHQHEKAINFVSEICIPH